jgi:hypothetical protein
LAAGFFAAVTRFLAGTRAAVDRFVLAPPPPLTSVVSLANAAVVAAHVRGAGVATRATLTQHKAAARAAPENFRLIPAEMATLVPGALHLEREQAFGAARLVRVRSDGAKAAGLAYERLLGLV